MSEYLTTTEGIIQRPTNCATTSHWATHYSPECRKFGNGVCDGYCPHGDQCTCPCHETTDLPETIVEVEAWHHEFHGVVLAEAFEVVAVKVVEFCWECHEDGNGEVEATESDDNGPLCEGCHGRRAEDGLIE